MIVDPRNRPAHHRDPSYSPLRIPGTLGAAPARRSHVVASATRTPSATKPYTTHMVRYGSTPSQIARMHNIGVADLVAANPQKRSGFTPSGMPTFVELVEGERLHIPASRNLSRHGALGGVPGKPCDFNCEDPNDPTSAGHWPQCTTPGHYDKNGWCAEGAPKGGVHVDPRGHGLPGAGSRGGVGPGSYASPVHQQGAGSRGGLRGTNSLGMEQVRPMTQMDLMMRANALHGVPGALAGQQEQMWFLTIKNALQKASPKALFVTTAPSSKINWTTWYVHAEWNGAKQMWVFFARSEYNPKGNNPADIVYGGGDKTLLNVSNAPGKMDSFVITGVRPVMRKVATPGLAGPGTIGGAGTGEPCAFDTDCDFGYCVWGFCQMTKEQPQGAGGCQSDNDCGAGSYCDTNLGLCIGKPGAGCKADADCGVGEVCQDGQCLSGSLQSASFAPPSGWTAGDKCGANAHILAADMQCHCDPGFDWAGSSGTDCAAVTSQAVSVPPGGFESPPSISPIPDVPPGGAPPSDVPPGSSLTKGAKAGASGTPCFADAQSNNDCAGCTDPSGAPGNCMGGNCIQTDQCADTPGPGATKETAEASKTMLYVGIGAAALVVLGGGAFLLTRGGGAKPAHALPAPMADDDVTLHRKGCHCGKCKMNGPKPSAFTAKKVISRDDWTRLGKPSTIESYLAALERANPAPPKEDMVVLHGSNRAAPGGIAPKVKLEIPRSEWERLGRPGTTHSYQAALEREKNPPPPPADTIVIRGSVMHRGGDATKLTKEIPREEWERLGRPRTIDRYHAALEAETKARTG